MIKSAEPEVVQQGDIGTKIRHDRKELELVTDHKGKQKARVRNASVLDELKNRKHITQDQYSAGGQLYHDWYYGVATRDGCTTQNYEPRPQSSPGYRSSDYTEWQMQRWQAYHRAMGKLEGLGSYIAKGVCCENKTLKNCEDLFHLPGRYATPRLCESLDTLAVHYGIVQE